MLTVPQSVAYEYAERKTLGLSADERGISRLIVTQPQIWTLGHSNRTLEEFIELLAANNIQAIADVRRFPGSRKNPQFGQEALQQSLSEVGIEYAAFPELGGRRTPRPDSHNTVWRNDAFRGYADYMETEDFRLGIERLLQLATGARTAVMCAESVWWRCHRSMIADYLKAKDFEVSHIMSPTKTESHPYTSAARVVEGELTYRTS